ncbi:MAG: sulfite exporter TauE/SafE family protein, partial [Phycisphaerae bacterium]|nr:sulfite exporter TauE/SafE family protein [Gemmatimonadaceae bacterium]
WDVVAVFSAVAIVGSLAASRWSTRLPQSVLRKGFGVLLVCLSVLILAQNRHEFARWLPQ